MPSIRKKRGLLYLCEAELVDYIRTELNYPGLEQAAVLYKTNANGHCETWYLLTSRSLKQLGPTAFLATIRKHWQIENGLHHVKDRTLKEDAHRSIYPNQGHSLAILRNAVISVLNKTTPPHKRKLSRPLQAIHFLTHPLSALNILRHA